jgi:hypothetical protein
MKDYVPDHYPLGYLMVNYGRRNMGLISGQRLLMMPAHLKDYFIHSRRAIKNILVLIIKLSCRRF